MKAFLLFALLFPAFLAHPDYTFAQKKDEFVELPDSSRQKEHSPTKATLMSVCLPGLGQVYNKKYWKVPVIYAGLGIMGYFIYSNANEYINYKCAYIESSRGNLDGNYSYLTVRYTKDELLSYREYYRRNLEITILITAVWYALNILDATVDAHLYTFNISDNLTMRVEPALLPTGTWYKPAGGVKLCLRF
jgi:hypothetical protein